MEETTPDQQVDDLAAQQYGAIGHSQAQNLGMTWTKIRERRRTGRWLPAGHGVSVVAAVPGGSEQRAAVAILRGPAGAVASHLTAPALPGGFGYPPPPPVSVPSPSRGRPPR